MIMPHATISQPTLFDRLLRLLREAFRVYFGLLIISLRAIYKF